MNGDIVNLMTTLNVKKEPLLIVMFTKEAIKLNVGTVNKDTN